MVSQELLQESWTSTAQDDSISVAERLRKLYESLSSAQHRQVGEKYIHLGPLFEHPYSHVRRQC